MLGREMLTNSKLFDIGDYVKYNNNIGVIRKIYMFQTKPNIYEVVFQQPSQKLKLHGEQIEMVCANE